MTQYPVSSLLACSFLSGTTLLFSACEARGQKPKATAARTEPNLAVKAVGPYLLLQREGGSSTYVCTDGARIPSLRALQARFGDAFLWFHHEKKAFVLQDPATLAKARELFREDPDLEAQDKALEAQEAQLDERRDDLDARRDRLEAQRDHLDQEREQLEEDDQASTQAHARLDAEMKRLDQRLELLDKEGQSLDQAFETLSQQRDALSDREEQRSQQAEAQLRSLLAASVKGGVAQPVGDKIYQP